MLDTALRCLARITWMLIEKRAEDRGIAYFKSSFYAARLFGIEQLYVGESYCAVLLFCPWLRRREPSQCWWVWVYGEWQAKTLPVNQRGCLAVLLHSLGDEICVILPWGISPRRCLHPPSTVPSPPRPPLLLRASLSTLFIPSGLSLWKCLLFSSFLYSSSSSHLYSPVCLSAQLSSSAPAAPFCLLLFLWICSSAVLRSFTL